ncbi:hypothetical protein KUCAC02_003040 [Chaenocephalus aceratus]|uniref:Uncharacterized protein n=1 Tax=Chaenocephalus aceratus TaxID=36190 RepID=A0ACB9WJU0_CHAAC|nr:hypothetical protein KUCAC02_003040 [Chaenocephalus aceratus]
MLITLCYVYLWVRFNKCYSVLIRNSLCRLNSSSFSFGFRLCSSPASATSPTGAPNPPPPEDKRLPPAGGQGRLCHGASGM